MFPEDISAECMENLNRRSVITEKQTGMEIFWCVEVKL